MRGLVERLQKVKLFVLDMDGTIYLGDRLFPYTKSFLGAVEESGREYCFFTNNSSKNRGAYLEKLCKMGIIISPEKMLVSNQVIIKWLKEKRPGRRAYVVGTAPLMEDFRLAGIKLSDAAPDYVVLGFDTSLTYEKISKACHFIRNGAEVFGVNPDLNCPVEGGFIPDCGSIAALVKASTGVRCEFFGKPSRHTLEYILGQSGHSAQEIAVVGDRLYTDVAVAAGTQVTSVLVMSGETTEEMLAGSDIKPDIIAENVGEIGEYLRKNG